MSVLHLSAENFDETIEHGRVLVDFWASWCMPCKMVAPVIEEIAAENEGKLTVAKVDVDNNTNIAARYNIMSIPTVIVFQEGAEVKRLIGVQPKATYVSAIN